MMFTCACCGYRTLDEGPGSYVICQLCFWEDDPVQLLDPWFRGGANTVSLAEAQVNFVASGASEPRFRSDVREPGPTDERDPKWRHVADSDRARVTTPAKLEQDKPGVARSWYYWEQ